MISKDNYRFEKKENIQLSNIWDAMLKGRNKNYTSLNGLKDHLIAYISSQKARGVSDVLSNIGGHGAQRIIHRIIKDSELALDFEDPQHCTLFVSFDNIQQLMLQHRIMGQEQNKVYAIIVCSILGLLPAGYTIDKIQYQACHSQVSWFTDLNYDENSDTYYNKLDNTVLKSMASNSNNDDILNSFWETDLERELKIVMKETDVSGDAVDCKIRENLTKKTKICNSGHINSDIHPKRKYCVVCKDLLSEMNDESYFTFEEADKGPGDVTLVSDDQNKRKIFYMEVENVESSVPKQISMGAIEVNPNSEKRIRFVLDHILKKTNLKKKYSVEFSLENRKLKKSLIENDTVRTWILLTVDGLPAKQLINIIENTYTCIQCSKRMSLDEIRKHETENNHTKYFQTYSVFVLNIGSFHYCQAMSRSFTKLLWNIDLSSLASSINLSSIKAQLMLSNGQDFRKQFDFLRTCRISRIK